MTTQRSDRVINHPDRDHSAERDPVRRVGLTWPLGLRPEPEPCVLHETIPDSRHRRQIL